MNWFMPAFASRSPDSGGGISDEERDAAMFALFEERQEQLPDALGLHAGQSTDGYAAGGSSCGVGAGSPARSSRSRSSIA